MHTNSTTYYNLPQFVGTDIVNDLTDTNGAYSAIDSAIHDVASSIGEDSAKIAALEAQNGDTVLTTTAQTLSGAVNELDDDLNNATTGAFALISGNTADIAGIENTIGDSNSGMIKDIGQLQTTVGAQGLSISSLETTVGGVDSGLVKDVADLKSADVVIQQDIASLQGSVVRIDGKVGSATLDTTAQDLSGAVNELNTAIGAITVPTAAEVSYDNTTSGLTADDVQEAIDEICANNISATGVDLSSYTSTPYTCPADGYAQIGNAAGVSGVIKAVVDPSDLSTAVTLCSPRDGATIAVFVKKGTQLVVAQTPSSAMFYPLS